MRWTIGTPSSKMLVCGRTLPGTHHQQSAGCIPSVSHTHTRTVGGAVLFVCGRAVIQSLAALGM